MAKPYCQERRHIMLISRNPRFVNRPNTAMTRHHGVAAKEVKSTMEATRAKSGTGFGQSWRELSHTPTYQVPIVLGAFVALIVGILTYLFDASQAGAIVAATTAEAYLVVFGIGGLIGCAVSKENVQNGSIVAMIAGLAITVLVATQLGLFAGLLLLAGASWSLASTR